MLVLSRKQGEEIVIGHNIRLTVVAIRGNQVRLGISAPPQVGIYREELGTRDEDIDALPRRATNGEAGL